MLGTLILIGALVVIGVYGWLLYMPEYRIAALIIVATIAVVGVLGIIAWIGWTMATTPSPSSMDNFGGELVVEESEKVSEDEP